jgi:hypothetical protein
MKTLFLSFTILTISLSMIFKSCSGPPMECSNAAEYYDIEEKTDICRCVQGNYIYHIKCEYLNKR